MRIASFTTAWALLLAGSVAGTAAAVAGPPSKSSTRPTLRITDTDPLTVRGANFKVGEQVTVNGLVRHAAEGRAPLRQRKLTRTGSAGGFTVSLPSLEIEGCALIVVTATGASGDKAAAKIMPECAAQ